MLPTPLRRAALAAPVFASFLLAACGKSGPPPAPPPVEVGIVVVQERPIAVNLTYMARTAGVREVEVRARVNGILLQRQYEEGARVREGALLFRIDPSQYQATAARTRAQMSVAKAQMEEARRERDRVGPLVAQGLVSRRENDQAVSAFESAEANFAAAQAALKGAELDLSYTEVRAPISGLTSRENRSEGSLVTLDGDSNLLTRIVQTDPLYIEFGMPAGEAALVRGSLGKEGVHVTAMTADGKSLPQKAQLTFIDTAVDPASGTVQARATLKNSGEPLLPGQFLRARIEGVELPKTTMIPTRAVLRSPMGAIVWVVGQGDKVQPRPVQTGDTLANETVILSGLNAGERVIVDGVMKVQPDAVVKPVTSGARDEKVAPGAKSPPPAHPAG